MVIGYSDNVVYSLYNDLISAMYSRYENDKIYDNK